ncbi:MAG: hypothetical protein C5B44_00405 [Acidobacteria bacterium]|nr:MAG: hypothetical protein C5B44_00405 [Acidobacteriota bacterium]
MIRLPQVIFHQSRAVYISFVNISLAGNKKSRQRQLVDSSSPVYTSSLKEVYALANERGFSQSRSFASA